MSTRLRAAGDDAQRPALTESGAVYSFEWNGWRNSKWRTCRSHELATWQLDFLHFLRLKLRGIICYNIQRWVPKRLVSRRLLFAYVVWHGRCRLLNWTNSIVWSPLFTHLLIVELIIAEFVERDPIIFPFHSITITEKWIHYLGIILWMMP